MGARLTKPRQATDGVSLVKPSKDADKLVELPILLKKHRSRSRAESAAVKVLDAVKRPSSVKGRTMKDILKTFSNDPQFVSVLTEVAVKQAREEEQLYASRETGLTSLYVIPDDTAAALSRRARPVYHIGLYDDAEVHLLRLSLFSAASRPRSSHLPLDENDCSTWSLTQLKAKGMRELACLQAFAGESYVAVVSDHLAVHALNQSCNGVPFENCLWPVDKSSLRERAGDAVEFRIMAEAFASGNEYNSSEQLSALGKLLFAKSAARSSVRLISSPLNSVTLPDASRVKAAIPTTASFYSYCYPVVQSITDAMAVQGLKLNEADPLVMFLTMGGFIYYDFTFDIVRVNAISLRECETHVAVGSTTMQRSSLCLGESCGLPLSCISPLLERQRWVPVATKHLHEHFGFTHFCWILPSEFLGDHIFTPSGGFAYLHGNDATLDKERGLVEWHNLGSKQSSRFFPIVRNDAALERPSHQASTAATPDPQLRRTVLVNKSTELGLLPTAEGLEILTDLEARTRHGERTLRPVYFETPIHIDGEWPKSVNHAEKPNSHKFHGDTPYTYSTAVDATVGLPGLLVDVLEPDELAVISRLIDQFGLDARAADVRVQLIRHEVNTLTPEVVQQLIESKAVLLSADEEKREDRRSLADALLRELQASMHEILDKPAVTIRSSESNALSGKKLTKDEHNNGKTLSDFHSMTPAKKAQLSLAEVAALRLYTTRAFRLVNGPLRQGIRPHPLAATTLFISRAVKKLRANHMHTGRAFSTQYLWRGLRNVTISEEFMLNGGTEPGCMSTSRDLATVANYALSTTPLLFRIRVDSPMELGADISWVSMYPDEQEVLYPPLTYIQPLFKQRIAGRHDGWVVTVKPSFPT